MPVGLCKPSQTRHHAPEEYGNDQPDRPPSIVRQEAGKYPSQYIEVVEHWTSHDLVDQATPTMLEFTQVVKNVCAILHEENILLQTDRPVFPAIKGFPEVINEDAPTMTSIRWPRST